ncbi:hypothetical protein C7401_113123 [Paraburkholderia unamae]|nr:hypothetical protein C7401_113123 [Paraburkholderia unamae]
MQQLTRTPEGRETSHWHHRLFTRPTCLLAEHNPSNSTSKPVKQFTKNGEIR